VFTDGSICDETE
jgi:hypothetical protein